ncbi:MAG: fluoride efflux transporter CrcB [Rhodobacteraceae bacterium]|nr:fluoride efflux transporter CrcB [Paracoccaceae bacterium]
MLVLLQVAIGGALGAVARYLVVLTSLRVFGPAFPVGTLSVNVFGSLLMGAATFYFIHRVGDPKYGTFVLTGLLGGFTTFSAFSLDAVNLWEKGRLAAASFYVAGSVGLSIAALLAGFMIMRTALS